MNRKTLGSHKKSVLPHKVIIVEDDAILGLLIEQTLMENGVEGVAICSTAACALERLRSGSYDGAVLDVHLADSHEGWEIAELIGALGDINVRIVFQTGSPQDIPEEIKQLGPVLTKPYELQELVEALKTKPRSGFLTSLRRKQ